MNSEHYLNWPFKIRNIGITFALSPTVFLSLQSGCSIERNSTTNFSPQNNGAHVKVIPPLGVSYSNENKLGQQSSPPF